MIWVDQQTLRLWCLLDYRLLDPATDITFLSSVAVPQNETMEASFLRLSASQRFFCPKLLQLFDGGVSHRPRSQQLDSSLVPYRYYQGLLVLGPSAHSDPGYTSTIRRKLETCLGNSIPGPERRFDIHQVHLGRQSHTPMEPDYLFALTADMNNLLAHSMGLDWLQRLPLAYWPTLRIDADVTLIGDIFEAVSHIGKAGRRQVSSLARQWSRIAFHAPYRSSIRLTVYIDQHPGSLDDITRWFRPFKKEFARLKFSASTAPRFHVEVRTTQPGEYCIAALVPLKSLNIVSWIPGHPYLESQCLYILNHDDWGDYLSTDFWNPEVKL